MVSQYSCRRRCKRNRTYEYLIKCKYDKSTRLIDTHDNIEVLLGSDGGIINPSKNEFSTFVDHKLTESDIEKLRNQPNILDVILKE